jgi:TPR repeat protein
MSKSSNSKQSRRSKSEALFFRADKKWNSGDLQAAFRLFLAAAKAGDKAAQLNVGNCYDTGSGIRRNRSSALYWYKRAYRRGDASAATAIGTVWRDAGKPQRALTWFLRAVKLGDEDSNLDIAKHYLVNEKDPQAAIPYLEKVCQSDRVTEASAEEAKRLLKRAKKGLGSTKI